jgi:hypothetical protein
MQQYARDVSGQASSPHGVQGAYSRSLDSGTLLCRNGLNRNPTNVRD